MKKVSVVVLNFKVKDQTIACVKSILKSTYQNLSLIVVDNDSGDGIAEEIKAFPEITFIQNKENLGYSGGNNTGIKLALINGADYVLILNSDTTIDGETIICLVKVADNGRGDVLGPKILLPDKKTIWYAGGIFDKNNVLGKHRGVDEKDGGQYDQIGETDYVTGAALFIRKEVFESIGLFDERYFLYYEDNDFCFRASQAGFKVMYIPSAVVFHANAQSTGLGSSLQDYYMTRNRMLFASKFLPLRTRFALMREAVRNIHLPIRRKAFFDFLTGSFGKGNW